ncbi:hypothetical protein SGR_383 [Streptomyces griseus subsp. griseus NBRC 13350]|uniref:Uncharacterized protein n=1 Tax=Streptomyces griseus subsp. griseus (strain JCM 4626 / CBS 651.72 / NBRC 13350 / KCC S-0626 / ISP 5235) TaxID=455632 RepID=B1VQB1_STRGG|nr:hypothetical protein SGR_383 [Streptomyces griseus subsp. griseus NBRC 13350]
MRRPSVPHREHGSYGTTSSTYADLPAGRERNGALTADDLPTAPAPIGRGAPSRREGPVRRNRWTPWPVPGMLLIHAAQQSA